MVKCTSGSPRRSIASKSTVGAVQSKRHRFFDGQQGKVAMPERIKHVGRLAEGSETVCVDPVVRGHPVGTRPWVTKGRPEVHK
jgi:hypothetical protein